MPDEILQIKHGNRKIMFIYIFKYLYKKLKNKANTLNKYNYFFIYPYHINLVRLL